MSPDLALVRFPHRVYAGMAAEASPSGALAWLRRPLVAALAVGLSVAISTTRHVTLALVSSTTVCWLWTVAAQLAIAAAFVAPYARRGVGVRRALDLFFASHVPWSLTLLGFAALMAATSPIGRGSAPLLLFLVPIVLTPRMLAAFFEQVLRLDRRRARGLTAAHQAITWGGLLAAYSYTVQVSPRLVGLWR